MHKNIIFVCTANMCRSPMAEYMLKARLPKGSVWTVSSAGTMAGDGMDGTPNSVETLKEVGLDMSSHRTRALTQDMIRDASVIVAMAQAHVDEILSLEPSAEEKVFLLRSFDPHADTRDVPDPVGWDIDVYRGMREIMDSALPGLIDFLAELEGR